MRKDFKKKVSYWLGIEDWGKLSPANKAMLVVISLLYCDLNDKALSPELAAQEMGMPLSLREIRDGIKMLREHDMLGDDGLKTVGSENSNDELTLGLWACVLEGNLKRTVKNGEAMYQSTDSGLASLAASLKSNA